jgi:hypothetical protein
METGLSRREKRQTVSTACEAVSMHHGVSRLLYWVSDVEHRVATCTLLYYTCPIDRIVYPSFLRYSSTLGRA